MCGIAGYIGKNNIDKIFIDKTLSIMKNRGPDNQDYSNFKFDSLNTYLLHSRLSIIDLDKRSNQPFSIGDFTIVFNGEIYNYIEVKNVLLTRGYTFKTESDTEVLINAFKEFGHDCVKKFNGMWSFAIWDNKEKKLFLSTDRFGEKPLFLLEENEGIYFASEIKFLKSLTTKTLDINTNKIKRYLMSGYKSLYVDNSSYYHGIKNVPYATNIVINSQLKLKYSNYWKPSYHPKEISFNDAIDGTREHMINSMKIRLRSDVPIAFCLSGGVDSSALVSIASNYFNMSVKTFSIIDPDERYNEEKNIFATIDDTGSDSTLVYLEYDNMIDRLKQLIDYHDAPVATISYLIHSMLSEKISNQGMKVVFSGTGADEIFTGYYDHYLLHLNEALTYSKALFEKHKNSWETYIKPIIRNPLLKDPFLFSNNPSFRGHVYDNNGEFSNYFFDTFKSPFTEKIFTKNLLRNRMMNEMFHEVIPVILNEDDLNSMYYSIENRSPYLDHNLFEFIYSIPGEMLIQNGLNKYLLREAVNGVLNNKVRLDKQKKGFNASINSIINFKDKNTIDFLLEPSSSIFNIVKRDSIETLINKNSLPNHFSKFLFSFLNSKIFLDNNTNN